jgi:hypothetical protein
MCNGSPVGLVHWQSRPQAQHDWKLLLEARLIALAWQLKHLIGSR